MSAQAQPPRLAVVSEGGAPVQEAVALAEAHLGESGEVRLVERGAIQKVLDEQKLSASGLIEPEKAIAVGALVSAQLLALVESSADGKTPVAIVVFDTESGVRLSDAALAEGNTDAESWADVLGDRGGRA